jgi:oligosaccharyltransferase complex subunit alpha (ribophorin I)
MLIYNNRQMHVYKIHLKEKVEPDQDVKIGVQLVYTHLVRPLPEKIPQISKQHVSFANNIYLFSAYSTDEMKTTFV